MNKQELVELRLRTHFCCGTFVAQQKLHLCDTLLQSLATNRTTKFRIRTFSISLQLVVEMVNADWSILVYVQLFIY